MPRPIIDLVVPVCWAAHELEDQFEDLSIAPLPTGSDHVGRSQPSRLQNFHQSSIVIVYVDPVPNIAAIAVQLGLVPFQDIGDLSRNEFLYVLVRPIVV